MTDPLILDELDALLADLANDRDGARGVRAVLGLRLVDAARSLIDDARELSACDHENCDLTQRLKAMTAENERLRKRLETCVDVKYIDAR